MTIYIGDTCIDRASYQPSNRTLINQGNPSSGICTIEEVCVYAPSAFGGAEFATFIHEGGNVFSTNGDTNGSNLSGSEGLNTYYAPGDFTAFSCGVGDYPGTYIATGGASVIDLDTSGGTGLWYYLSTDQIPCSSVTFSGPLAGRALSLYFTGTEAGGLVKIMNETVQIQEAAIRRMRAIHIIAETVQLTEGILRRARSVRIISETVNIAEGLIKVLSSVVIKIMNETINISEAAVRRMRSIRAIAETINIQEAVSRRMRSIRILSENLNIQDATIRRMRSVRVISETVNITEGFVKFTYTVIVKIMNETINITEGMVITFGQLAVEAARIFKAKVKRLIFAAKKNLIFRGKP